ncbi:MAG: hypothetical protein HKN33_18115 [Pyrinomonadaceae bacterium]|nr:hypothetical protein [Pyrinomonadaceae bacterium]
MSEQNTAKDLDNLSKLSYFYYVSEAISALIFAAVIGGVFVGRLLYYFGAVKLMLAFASGGMVDAAVTMNDELQLNSVLLPASVMLGSVAGIIGLYGVISGYYYIRFVRERKHYVYCMVLSGLTATSFPIGTIVGILSILILMKEDVRDIFNAGSEREIAPLDDKRLGTVGRYFTFYGSVSFFLSLLAVPFIISAYILFAGDFDKAIVVRDSNIPLNYLLTSISVLIFGLSLSLCTLLAGSLLKRRKGFVFIIIVSAFLSLFPPFGTILGIWTIFLLFSDPGRASFRNNE